MPIRSKPEDLRPQYSPVYAPYAPAQNPVAYADTPTPTNGAPPLDPKLVLVALTVIGVIGIIALVIVSKRGGK